MEEQRSILFTRKELDEVKNNIAILKQEPYKLKDLFSLKEWNELGEAVKESTVFGFERNLLSENYLRLELGDVIQRISGVSGTRRAFFKDGHLEILETNLNLIESDKDIVPLCEEIEAETDKLKKLTKKKNKRALVIRNKLGFEGMFDDELTTSEVEMFKTTLNKDAEMSDITSKSLKIEKVAKKTAKKVMDIAKEKGINVDGFIGQIPNLESYVKNFKDLERESLNLDTRLQGLISDLK